MNMTPRPSRSGIRRWGAATLGALVLGACCLGCGGGGTKTAGASAPAPTVPPHPTVFAPYLEVATATAPQIAAQAQAAQAKLIDLSFIVDQGECQPGWDGAGAYTNPVVVAQAQAVRAAGGQVAIAFGGAQSKELATGCESVGSLVSAYQKVIDAYGATDVDMDVEGATLNDTAATHRRDLALRQLQDAASAHGQQLRVTFTLPTDQDGPSRRVAALLADAVAAGVRIDAVNVMAMDFGSPIADLTEPIRSAATGAQALLKRTWPSLSDAAAWQLLGLTVMIGKNDDPGETLSLRDAQTITSFVHDKGIGRLGFWSVGRDRKCGSGQSAAYSCSGVAQQEYAFGHTFAAVGG